MPTIISLAVFAYDAKYCYGRMSLILADLELFVSARQRCRLHLPRARTSSRQARIRLILSSGTWN